MHDESVLSWDSRNYVRIPRIIHPRGKVEEHLFPGPLLSLVKESWWLQVFLGLWLHHSSLCLHMSFSVIAPPCFLLPWCPFGHQLLGAHASSFACRGQEWEELLGRMWEQWLENVTELDPVRLRVWYYGPERGVIRLEWEDSFETLGKFSPNSMLIGFTTGNLTS